MTALHGSAGEWTGGEPAILYRVCGACRAVWYFQRRFCPRCGSPEPRAEHASGHGAVAAITTVHRAPSAELRAYVPYCIVLVDADEGFRMMAHGGRSLAIGDRVTARFIPFGGGMVPHFERSG